MTLVVIVTILLALSAVWVRYQIVPSTRDGKVRADIVPIAADISGLVTDVRVRDNQAVAAGDILLVVDPPRYRLALQQAEANVVSQRALLAQAIRDDRRNRAIHELIATEVIEQGLSKVEQLRGLLSHAEAARDLARLNLARTEVRAPVDGIVSNVGLQPGVYLSAGKIAMALVCTGSLRVEGYFEETKLPAIHVGDRARIHLMGVAHALEGHVDSIAAGIEDRERGPSDTTLANINPSFTWVRLAQRIPVRIAIDQLPADVRLVSGQTATVEILGTEVMASGLKWLRQ